MLTHGAMCSGRLLLWRSHQLPWASLFSVVHKGNLSQGNDSLQSSSQIPGEGSRPGWPEKVKMNRIQC